MVIRGKNNGRTLANGWKQGAAMATMTQTACISIRLLWESCNFALRRFSSGSSRIFCTTKQMPAKFATATAAPTSPPSTTVSSNLTQPTRCSAAKITHMAAVQTAVPQVMRSSSFLDSGCNFIANPPTFIDAS